MHLFFSLSISEFMVSWLAPRTGDPLQLSLVLLSACWHCVTLLSPAWSRALRWPRTFWVGTTPIHISCSFSAIFGLSIGYNFAASPLSSSSPSAFILIFFLLSLSQIQAQFLSIFFPSFVKRTILQSWSFLTGCLAPLVLPSLLFLSTQSKEQGARAPSVCPKGGWNSLMSWESFPGRQSRGMCSHWALPLLFQTGYEVPQPYHSPAMNKEIPGKI